MTDYYDMVEAIGSDEEVMIAAVSYLYGCKIEDAEALAEELSGKEKQMALDYFELRDLPAELRLKRFGELYPAA